MAKDVKFNIKLVVDGKEKIVEATADIKKFAQEFENARTESTKLRDDLLKVTQVTTSFQNAMSGLQQLTGLMQTYTAASALQEESEAKLANNMRNTMGAREEDIQSIKDLCSAQQQLGVIGDEVQLAGAQELATYLEQKSSLEKLIPVMNDMVAQQYGLNATQESATNIATMLGKVMEGQVGALSRYGYKFDEAQEQVLKFGTEEERVAVLSEVVESAVGGMNEALAQTDAGKAKQAANDIGDMKEKIGAVIAPLESAIIKVGQFSLAINAISTTVGGIRGIYVAVVSATGALKNLAVVTYAQTAAGKVAAAVQSLWAKQLYYGRQAQIAWAFSAKLATVQAIAMRAAIMGLMAVTGIGLAFVAVSSIISLFSSKTDDATKSMQDAEAEAKRLQESQNEEVQAGAQAAATLELQKEKLKNLIDAKKTGKDVSKEEKKIVGELNDAYGDTMGYFDSVSKWYDALIANSEDYCRQMVIEAKTRRLANQIAEKEAETHSLIYDDKGNKKKYSTKNETYTETEYTEDVNGQKLPSGWHEVEIPGTSELDKVNKQIRDNNAQVKDLQKQMQDAVTEAAKLDFKVKGSVTRPATTTTTKGGKNGKEDKQLIENAKTYKDLANNVAYYQQELEKCDITDTERIVTLAKAKKAAEDAVKAFKDMTDAATMPVELNTLDDYDKKLNALRNDRKTASKEHIAQIDAEIERIETAKQALEDESVAALKDEEIRTYDQLNKKLAYYNRLLESGDEKQREFAQKGINALNKLQESWDFALDETKLPSTTDSLKDIDAAISFYTDRQQREDADQIGKTQAIIDDLTAKKKTLQLGIELPQMRREISDIDTLTGKERRLKIKGIGFEELTKKVKDLQQLLNDTDHPVTEAQRKELEGMISIYEKWRKQTVLSFDTVREGWDSIKGIGSSIDSISEALDGNVKGWQAVTSVIDGFVSLYESIQSIIGIIDLLTSASEAHTVAKTAEGVATGATAAATLTAASADEGAAAATLPVIAANKVATASYMELASAMYFAAHASIPFAGFGIAAGFVSASTAMVQAIGVMPFAKGAVVSGPTLALVGEYSGARTNPEVIAPLDKLRSMIEPAGGVGGRVRFEIEGRKLVGVIVNEERISRKSGRKSLVHG